MLLLRKKINLWIFLFDHNHALQVAASLTNQSKPCFKRQI